MLGWEEPVDLRAAVGLAWEGATIERTVAVLSGYVLWLWNESLALVLSSLSIIVTSMSFQAPAQGPGMPR